MRSDLGARLTGTQYSNDTALKVPYNYVAFGRPNDVMDRMRLSTGILLFEAYKCLGLSKVVLRQKADGANLMYIGTSNGDGGICTP